MCNPRAAFRVKNFLRRALTITVNHSPLSRLILNHLCMYGLESDNQYRLVPTACEIVFYHCKLLCSSPILHSSDTGTTPLPDARRQAMQYLKESNLGISPNHTPPPTPRRHRATITTKSRRARVLKSKLLEHGAGYWQTSLLPFLAATNPQKE